MTQKRSKSGRLMRHFVYNRVQLRCQCDNCPHFMDIFPYTKCSLEIFKILEHKDTYKIFLNAQRLSFCLVISYYHFLCWVILQKTDFLDIFDIGHFMLLDFSKSSPALQEYLPLFIISYQTNWLLFPNLSLTKN
jgi:hypothetical protein